MKKSRIAAVLTAVTLVAAPALVGAPGSAQAVEPVVVPFAEVGANDLRGSGRCPLHLRWTPSARRVVKARAAAAAGGLGGQVVDLLTVLPGQSLQVNVGGAGGDAAGIVPGAGGFNGGAPVASG